MEGEARKPTLCEFYESHFKPIWVRGQGLNEKTARSYDETMSHWRSLTGDPPVDQITDLVTTEFMRKLAEQPGKNKRTKLMLPSSMRKHGRSVDTVLKMCGPRTRHNKMGQRILNEEPPFIILPRAEKKPPRRNWTIQEMKAMVNACHVMKRPTLAGVQPADWWRCLLAVGYFCGFRITTILKIRYDMITGNWIDVPGDCAKQNKGIRQFLHPHLVAVMNKIRVPGRNTILEWPVSRRYLYDELKILQAAAGIEEHRWFPYQSLRKTHATEYARAMAAANQALRGAQESCNHATIDVTLECYVGEDLQDEFKAKGILAMPTILEQSDELIVPESIAPVESRELELVGVGPSRSDDWLD